MDLKKGDLVTFDGLLAVIVGTETDDSVPQDHVALWYGGPETKRLSEGGETGIAPEIWTVPSEYCKSAPAPKIHH